MKNLTIESVENATIRVSNKNGEGRKVAITASATFGGNGFQQIGNGEVRTPEGSALLASFNLYGSDSLNISFQTRTESVTRGEITEEIEAFVAELRQGNVMDNISIA